MPVKERCQAKNRATCRKHGHKHAAMTAANVSLFLQQTEQQSEIAAFQERELAFMNHSIDHAEWEEYGPKVKALISSLIKKFGFPETGRTRAVFDCGDGTVLKVPFNDEGEMGNMNEAKAANQEEQFIPVASSRYEKMNGVDVLRMEKVEIVEDSRTIKNLPNWVGFVDCAQIGYTKTGRLVAYDL